LKALVRLFVSSSGVALGIGEYITF
jgi:hypothetical protein